MIIAKDKFQIFYMNNVSTINPEAFLENSKGNHFMVMLTSQAGTFFCYPGGSTHRVDAGPMDSPAIERRQVVETYYQALTSAKTLPAYGDCRLDIVEIPSVN